MSSATRTRIIAPPTAWRRQDPIFCSLPSLRNEGFIGDGLRSDRESLTASLARFVGSPAYRPAALRDDFARFRFLRARTLWRISAIAR